MHINVGEDMDIAQAEIAAELIGTAMLLDSRLGQEWFERETVRIDTGHGEGKIMPLRQISPWSLSEYKTLCDLFPFHGVLEAHKGGVYGSAATFDPDGRCSVGVYAAEWAANILRARISEFHPAIPLPIAAIRTESITFAQSQSTLTQGGASVSPVGGFMTGTLGAWLEDASSGDLIGISNNHVLTEFNSFGVGTDVIQPGIADGGNNHNVIGDIFDFVPLMEDDPKDPVKTINYVDVAWCKPKPTTTPQLMVGSPGIKISGEVDLAPLWRNSRSRSVDVFAVCKGNNIRRGRLINKGASIFMVDQATQKPYFFRDQLEFSFGSAQPGDSGSLILLDQSNEVGALLFGIRGSSVWGCPWQTVTREMNRVFRY